MKGWKWRLDKLFGGGGVEKTFIIVNQIIRMVREVGEMG